MMQKLWLADLDQTRLAARCCWGVPALGGNSRCEWESFVPRLVGPGGSSSTFCDLAYALQDQGHEVSVLTRARTNRISSPCGVGWSSDPGPHTTDLSLA